MILRYILPVLAVLGIISGIWFTYTYGDPAPAIANQLTDPPATPFEKTVSGTGTVESNTRDIAVGAYQSGIVAKVMVKEGQEIEQGSPLFIIDDEAASASVAQAREEVAVADASIAQAEVMLADEKDQLKRAEGLKAGSSISIDTLQRRRFAVKQAEANLAFAKAERARAQAALTSAEVNFEQHTMRAPVSGRIFKINIRPGEYVNLLGNQSFIIMGNDRPLHLRVQIDENDVWRYSKKQEAFAALRSNKEVTFPLTFVRVEPYVQPKRNLSGDTTELVDTRVLEVVYSFDPGKEPVYVGQQMDVFIKADE